MKRPIYRIILAIFASIVLFSGCLEKGAFQSDKEISVISREDGSGTRGAFIDLFDIEEKEDDGTKVDHTTDEASITNNTSVMLTAVIGNPYAIGYISLGSMNEAVKAVKIDGREVNEKNILNNSYKIYRPFSIVVKNEANVLCNDFINFILSSDGQAIVTSNGYVAVTKNPPYTNRRMTGKLVIAGSSSVTPVMEKLKEAYILQNPDVSIEIQQSDSSTGMTSVIAGICDIGMASRNLKDSELEAGLVPTIIAKDGLAVIVNKKNPIQDLSFDQVKSIFTGKTLFWSDLHK
jgi:phosphate transport system substrate-binding protein